MSPQEDYQIFLSALPTPILFTILLVLSSVVSYAEKIS